MKSASKPKERKKASPESSNLCPYCSKPGHPEEKCYYKHPERASEDFRLRFQNRIKELESKANAIRAQSCKGEEEQSEANRIYVVKSKGAILATGQHDSDWYFDDAASYHMTYDLNDFDDPATLT